MNDGKSEILKADASAITTTTLAEHPQRSEILGELHARPALPISIPRRIYRFAFQVSAQGLAADRAYVEGLAQSHGAPPPASDARFHNIQLGPWDFRWEQHTEFTTHTWTTASDADEPLVRPNPLADGELKIEPPGPLLVAIHISLLDRRRIIDEVASHFHPESLCIINAANNSARVSTDFHTDPNGFTRFIVESNGLTETRAGRLISRLLEIETYRTVALLGLPMARKVSPELSRMEKELVDITRCMSEEGTAQSNQDLLRRLSDLAAQSEVLTAETTFRFGATRAYHSLVNSRLEMLKETDELPHVRISTFFRRRLEPAIDTCNAVELRQQTFSGHLSRAADLLRTSVQLDLEKQNRDLLTSMDKRARLQLRLQETVEGLSIAAITYYVVGLITYLAKGLKDAGLLPPPVTPTIVTAFSVPLVIGAVWYLMRRVRKSFEKDDKPAPTAD